MIKREKGRRREMEEKKIKVMVEKRGQIYAFDLDEEEEMTQDEIEGYLADMEYRRMKDMELMWEKKKGGINDENKNV